MIYERIMKKKLTDSLAVKIFITALSALLMLVAAVFIINAAVVDSTKDSIYSHEDIPAMADDSNRYDYILVFGCGIRDDGSLSDMLKHRVYVGAQLFLSGLADNIIMSGDRSGESYDEPTAMKKYAMELGVPEQNIICDYMGYSTHESIDRFEESYKSSSVILVSQEYHLNRALYIAHEQGIDDAIAVSADLDEYSLQTIYDLREVLARVSDVIFMN